MIDPKDFKPLGAELRKIKAAHRGEAVLNRTADRMIRAMREWRKDWDNGLVMQQHRRAAIGKRLMFDLAWVTAFQWSH